MGKMGKINLKKFMIEEGFLQSVDNHLENNKGKYGVAAGGLGTAAGGTYLAGKGYLGVGPQDTVQNLAGKVTWDLDNNSIANRIIGVKNSIKDTYSRPDNIIDDPSNSYKTFEYQNYLQPSNYVSSAQQHISNGIKSFTNMDHNPDAINYVIRKPMENLDKVGEFVSKSSDALFNK